MAKPTKYQNLHKRLMAQTSRMFETKDGNEILTALSNGQNTYLRFDRFESSSMDMTWIKKIEETLPDLNDIVTNPKKTIQTLSEVVEIEKAKKTSSESVQHLASHTQFVKSIDEDGNITPSKILNIYNDDFFAIYENKFIATLIRRLFLFVEKRYQYIVTKANLEDVELLYFKNKTNFQGSEISIETKISYSRPASESTAEKMTEMLKRIGDIRSYLRFFTNSEFMKILQRERDVKNPILQTNIIRKNPKYRNCYQLWQFMNSYMEAGVDFRVEERYPKLTEEDLKEINKVMAMNFIALKGRDAPKQEVKTRQYRPRILKTYDDEIFNPGPKFEGPIEFIRVDDKYRQFSETLKELDPHPTKAMKEYIHEDYEDNKRRKKTTEHIDSLLKRKEHEYEKYQKEQEELLIKEQEDLEMISDLAEQQIIEEQEERLQPYRDMLANKGKQKPQEVKKVEPEPEIVEEEEEEERYIPESVQSLLDEPVEEPTQEQEPEQVVEEPIQEEPQQEEAPVEEEKPQEEVKEEQPAEEPVKKKRGGARPGAGRPRKAREEQPEPEPDPEPEPQPEPQPEPEPIVEEPVPEEEPVEEQPVKKQRGGARPGAGRPRKVQEVQPEPEPEPVVEEQPEPEPEEVVKKQRGGARPGAGRPRKAVEEPVEEPVKKARGGARPGAGRKPKPKEEPKPEPIKEEPKVVEPPKPVEQPKPVPAPKPMSKKEKRLARKAEREEKQAKILKVSSSRAGKKFGRRK